jgi:hypothetical protein
MTDLASALETAVFTRLTAQVTLGAVYQHVPEDTPPPVVIIADFFPEQSGGKGDEFERFEFDIVQVIRGAARKPLHALQSEVKSALHLWKPADASGISIGEVQHLNSTAQLLPDGQNYYGSMRFLTFVQTA